METELAQAVGDELAKAPDLITGLSILAYQWALEFLPKAGAALAVLIVGFIIIGWIKRRVRILMERSRRIDKTLAPIAAQVIYYAMLAVLLVAVLSQLGIQTASILAALGAAGLAIGLALQGTLSNIAAGVMLLWLRPFSAGDYVETANASGTVKLVGLFASELETFDGVYQFVPNSELWNTRIVNYSRNAARMMRIVIGIGYGDDTERARSVVLALAADEPRILDDPAPIAFVSELGDSAVGIELRAWAKTPDYWSTLRDMTERAKQAIEAEGIEIPFPQRVVHMVGGGAAA